MSITVTRERYNRAYLFSCFNYFTAIVMLFVSVALLGSDTYLSELAAIFALLYGLMFLSMAFATAYRSFWYRVWNRFGDGPTFALDDVDPDELAENGTVVINE